MAQTNSTIDRKMAGKLLGLSIRTIDRYIRSGKLVANITNGRIRLSKDEIIRFRKFGTQEKTTRMPIHIDTDNSRHIATGASTISAHVADNDFYEDLYRESKRMLMEYQQKLERANYRIGQLESTIMRPPEHAVQVPKTEIPNMEYVRHDMQLREKEVTVLREALRKERANRITFAVIAYVLLGFQIIVWYLLR